MIWGIMYVVPRIIIQGIEERINMPLYDYRCDECGHELDNVHQSMKDDALTTCPKCNAEALYRVPQSPSFSVSNTNSIGQRIDRQNKEMGTYHRSNVEAYQKSLQEPTDKVRTATSSEIKKMSPEKRTKYIHTGEK